MEVEFSEGGMARKLMVSHSSLKLLSLIFSSFYKIYTSQILNRLILDSRSKLYASLMSFNTLLYCFLRIASWL